MRVSRIAARTVGSFSRGIDAFGALFRLGAHASNVDVANGEKNDGLGVGLSRHRAFAKGCTLNAITPRTEDRDPEQPLARCFADRLIGDSHVFLINPTGTSLSIGSQVLLTTCDAMRPSSVDQVGHGGSKCRR